MRFADTNASARARGTLFVHACTRAMTTPIEWLLADVLGTEVVVDWRPQPIAPAMARAEVLFSGPVGTAARIVSGLRTIPHVRFEVTEHVAGLSERYSFTPSLGVFRADLDVHGNIVVGEQQLRSAMERSPLDARSLMGQLDALLGTAWDAELEPFRVAADNDPVRYLHVI